jgi:hypothetical protein
VFGYSGIRTITVEKENPFFKVSGSFLVDFSGTSLVRYFGDAIHVDIPSDVFTISDGCFADCGSIVSVTFAPGSSVRVLGESAFENCSSLQSIFIPSSVQTISESCFRCCSDLSDVRFEPGSQIVTVGDGAFDYCLQLQSIWMPFSIETISATCFG